MQCFIGTPAFMQLLTSDTSIKGIMNRKGETVFQNIKSAYSVKIEGKSGVKKIDFCVSQKTRISLEQSVEFEGETLCAGQSKG
jgi:hypothetical protein